MPIPHARAHAHVHVRDRPAAVAPCLVRVRVRVRVRACAPVRVRVHVHGLRRRGRLELCGAVWRRLEPSGGLWSWLDLYLSGSCLGALWMCLELSGKSMK